MNNAEIISYSFKIYQFSYLESVLLLHSSLPQLPEDIRIGVVDFVPTTADRIATRKEEKKTGKKLLADLIESEGFQNPIIKYEVSGKPYAVVGGRIIHVSLSHSRNKIIAAFSINHPIGIDIERAQRKVRPELRSRIYCDQNEAELLKDFSTVQIWSLKEAVLKCKGTGLRHAMKRIQIREANEKLTAHDGDTTFSVFLSELDEFIFAVAIQ